MSKCEMNFVLDILQEKPTVAKKLNWYYIVGLVEAHHITGYFYNRLKEVHADVPVSVMRIFANTCALQKDKVQKMSAEAERLSIIFRQRQIEHVFLKGSVFNNCKFLKHSNSNFQYYKTFYCQKIYQEGERVSNDIDVLLSPSGLDRASEVLYEIGYDQGHWDFSCDRFVQHTRKEIIFRRMNRGETSPFIRLTSDSVCPFLEVDINFSLDETATGKNIEMFLKNRELNGKLYSLESTDFFIHLLLHQYKESTVYSMVRRNKAFQLYKLLDIFLIVKNSFVSFEKVYEKCLFYKLETEALTVLSQTAEVFDSLKKNKEFVYLLEKLGQGFLVNDTVKDFETGKQYFWKNAIKARQAYFFHEDMLVEDTAFVNEYIQKKFMEVQ